MDGMIYANTAPEIISSLLRKISNRAKDEIQYLAMLDEATFDKNGFNFSKLFHGIQIEKLIGFIAVNPAAYFCDQDIIMQPPEGEDVKSYRLKTKHRNAFHITNLLVHYNFFQSTVEDNPYKMVSSAEDEKLNYTKKRLMMLK